jgi:hypothetical protein
MIVQKGDWVTSPEKERAHVANGNVTKLPIDLGHEGRRRGVRERDRTKNHTNTPPPPPTPAHHHPHITPSTRRRPDQTAAPQIHSYTIKAHSYNFGHNASLTRVRGATLL